MMPLTAEEKKSLIAACLDQESDDLIGWTVTGIVRGIDGPVVLSNAKSSAAIIYLLAQVINRLAEELADGNDMQAEAQARGNE